jgi:hypothetical protein
MKTSKAKCNEWHTKPLKLRPYVQVIGNIASIITLNRSALYKDHPMEPPKYIATSV